MLGRIFIATGVVVALSNFLLVDLSKALLTNYCNIHMNIERLLRLHSSFLLVAVGLFCCGFILVNAPNQKDMIIRFLYTDKLKHAAPRLIDPKNVLITTTVISVVLTLSYYIRLTLSFPQKGIFYREDGILESLTAIGFALASIFVAKYIIREAKKGISKRNQRLFFLAHLGVAFLFLIIFMEEISWGQRIFHWDTPCALKSINWQKETNIHNIFNDIWPILYQIAGICFVSFFSFGWWFYFRKSNSYWVSLFPHPSMVGIAVCIGAVSLVPSHEIIEQLASVFAFYYSVRMIYLSDAKKVFRTVDTE